MTIATQKSTCLSRWRTSGLLAGIVFIFSFALPPSAQAQFTYSDFSDVSNLALNGTALKSGNALRLTYTGSSSGRAGSAWYTTSQPVTNGFETTFTFQITGSAGPYCDSPGGGDGLTFTIQNNDTTALGNIGGFLGYHGIANSVAVEFDTCYNTWDPGTLSNRNHNHIGINLGSVASVATFTPSDNLNSGNAYAVRIVYNPGTLDVYFKNLNDPPVLSYPVDLPDWLGGETAYVGFTSGVAASYGNHDVLSWSFTPNLDSDGDGVNDDVDLCPDTPSGEVVDANGCSASQLDEDGDGVSDALDVCPGTPSGEDVDADGCSASQRDSDGDGVNDLYDYCAATAIPEMVPTVRLRPNRWALIDNDSAFDTVVKGKGKGPNRSYTTEDTAGCSCEQIIELQGLGLGHTYHGCSISAMDDWVDVVNMP